MVTLTDKIFFLIEIICWVLLFFMTGTFDVLLSVKAAFPYWPSYQSNLCTRRCQCIQLIEENDAGTSKVIENWTLTHWTLTLCNHKSCNCKSMHLFVLHFSALFDEGKSSWGLYRSFMHIYSLTYFSWPVCCVCGCRLLITLCVFAHKRFAGFWTCSCVGEHVKEKLRAIFCSPS